MKAAGLTHGGFYAHFDSKQELQEAAVAYGQRLTASRARSYGATKMGRKACANRYLSPWHRDNPELRTVKPAFFKIAFLVGCVLRTGAEK